MIENYYKRLSPFKWFVLQNFPFIEADFDALTNWQLFCAMGEEINKIIKSVNDTGGQVEILTNAFNDLQDYVNNYFDNLDIQEEVNNKLDEMAESGQLSDIIAQYLELQAVLGFNNIDDMRQAEYIANGSLLRTYGQDTLNDGKGAFYYVRTVQTTDVIDNVNIVALHDTSLVAIKCGDYNIQNLQNQINDTDFILNDECKIFFPYRGQNAGDCTVIQNNNKNIIIDFGWDTSNLITWLLNKNITKIDYIIISHYHADHIGGNSDTTISLLTFLSDSRFDFSDLVVYLPHKGINWSLIEDNDKTAIENNENTIKQYLTNNNIEYIEPNNGDILELSDISSIKFLNIGSSFYTNYYGNYGNEYNNFSMVCELKHNNRYALFTGDIYIQAQDAMVSYIHQPDILKAPHHDLEPLVSNTFMLKMTPSNMVFMENQSNNYSGLLTPLTQQIKKNGGNIYDTNNSQNILVTLKNDNIMLQSDNGVFTNISTEQLTCSGIHIKNIDLNNLTTPGTYYTVSDAETHTLNNLPLQTELNMGVSWGFGRALIRIESISADTSILIQTLRTGAMYWTRYKDGNSWSSWYNNRTTSSLGYTSSYVNSNSNLNDYVYEGKYQIHDNSIWSSLQNTPAAGQGGSILLVYNTRLANNIVHQVIMCATGFIFYRKYDTNSHTWSSWVKIQTTTP